jgi:excisionase family DNA binding protein
MGLLTVKDLGERWGLSEGTVKQLVREKSIPFVGLGSGDLRLNWNRVRFRPEAIERWEEEHQVTFKSDKPVVRLENHNRLGSWR